MSGGTKGVQYSLRALKIAESRAPGALSVYMSDWEKVEYGPHFVWVAQGGERTVLVNTGLPSDPQDLEILNASCRSAYPDNFFGPDHIWPPLPQLAALGIRPEDVDAVLITTIGTYATGNIERFPDAHVYLSRSGWLDFMAPVRPTSLNREVVLTDATLTYLVTRGWNRLHLVPDEEEVLPGIRMFWVGCHHRGSMAVSIQTAIGKVVISDSIFKYENLEPGTPIGVLENIFECRDALERVRREADVVFPTHDSRALDRHPGGIIA
jgi:glyoxylase-like metal-dependent hydrolase (beta-lactamase superfamily II)